MVIGNAEFPSISSTSAGLVEDGVKEQRPEGNHGDTDGTVECALEGLALGIIEGLENDMKK